jgi:hypothetical protein
VSSKAVLRFLIGCVIASLLLILILPAINIPKSYLLPPPIVYQNAKGTTIGFVNLKTGGANPNPFRTTEPMHYITYRFRAVPPNTMLEKATPDEIAKKKVYVGRANVTENFYQYVKIGDTIPIRYEVTRPDISGIDKDGGGTNDQAGGALIGSWVLFVLGVLVLGYMMAPLLQRIMLREDY